jgi:hypothetical protein
MEAPHEEHLVIMKCVLRYVARTRDHGLHYNRKKGETLRLFGYSDADMAGDIDTPKSTSGIIFFLGNSPITWQSAKQKVIALSSCEAEYITVAVAACQGVKLSWLLNDLVGAECTVLELKVDNMPAIALSKKSSVP